MQASRNFVPWCAITKISIAGVFERHCPFIIEKYLRNLEQLRGNLPISKTWMVSIITQKYIYQSDSLQILGYIGNGLSCVVISGKRPLNIFVLSSNVGYTFTDFANSCSRNQVCYFSLMQIIFIWNFRYNGDSFRRVKDESNDFQDHCYIDIAYIHKSLLFFQKMVLHYNSGFICTIQGMTRGIIVWMWHRKNLLGQSCDDCNSHCYHLRKLSEKVTGLQ